MPGMSGLDLQATLRCESSFLPIIFITGLGDIPMAVRAMREGAIDFLTKPVDDVALLKSVERAFQQYREGRRQAFEHQHFPPPYQTFPPPQRPQFSPLFHRFL